MKLETLLTRSLAFWLTITADTGAWARRPLRAVVWPACLRYRVFFPFILGGRKTVPFGPMGAKDGYFLVAAIGCKLRTTDATVKGAATSDR